MDPIEVNHALDDAITIISHQMKLSKIDLEAQLEPDLPMIHGNSNQLQQVFMNLMINVQQALDEKPGSLLVTSHALPSGEVELRFKDSGPGMTKETKEKLFEPFYTTKPNGKGTGLGLSVSFGIIKDHGGLIQVESEPGKGAEFIITLPTIAGAERAVVEHTGEANLELDTHVS
jgi:two-component system NtrC family sensor kinase